MTNTSANVKKITSGTARHASIRVTNTLATTSITQPELAHLDHLTPMFAVAMTAGTGGASGRAARLKDTI